MPIKFSNMQFHVCTPIGALTVENPVDVDLAPAEQTDEDKNALLKAVGGSLRSNSYRSDLLGRSSNVSHREAYFSELHQMDALCRLRSQLQVNPA